MVEQQDGENLKKWRKNMKKLVKILAISALVVASAYASDKQTELDTLPSGAAFAASYQGFESDTSKVEEYCRQELKKYPLRDHKKTEENMNYMVSKCVKDYKKDKGIE